MIERFVALECAKENSGTVAAYMGLLHWVTAFLRRLGEPDLDDQQLLKVTHIVMAKQEQGVKQVLGMLNYELEEEDIRTMMDLSVRGGPGTVGRIEEVSVCRSFLASRLMRCLSECFLCCSSSCNVTSRFCRWRGNMSWRRTPWRKPRIQSTA